MAAQREAKRLDELDYMKIAFLKSRNLKQSDIANALGTSEAAVSRVLAPEGKAAKYLRILPPQFDWSLVNETQEKQLRAMLDEDDLSGKLAELLSGQCKTVSLRATVISATAEISNPASIDGPLAESFYASAASVIWPLLSTGKIIGITWGRSLAQLLAAARKLRLASPYQDRDRNDPDQPQVIPLCGESLGSMRPSSLSSSALAQGFGELLTSRAEDEYLSLNMVPVFFPGPQAFDERELRGARKLLNFSLAYVKVFGPQPDGTAGPQNPASRKSDRPIPPTSLDEPLAERLDVVVTSISRENRPFGMGDSEENSWNAVLLADLERLLIGDLAGVPLHRPRLTPKENDKLDELLQRWTGLKESHLRDCAARAMRNGKGPAGVIVIGSGVERVSCVLEAVRRGLVNHVVVDEALGRALIDRLTAR